MERLRNFLKYYFRFDNRAIRRLENAERRHAKRQKQLDREQRKFPRDEDPQFRARRIGKAETRVAKSANRLERQDESLRRILTEHSELIWKGNQGDESC